MEEIKEIKIDEVNETEEDIDTESGNIYAEPMIIESLNDLAEFAEGVRDYAKYVGAFSTLVSGGFDTQQAFELIITNVAVESNLKIAQIKQSQIEQESL